MSLAHVQTPRCIVTHLDDKHHIGHLGCPSDNQGIGQVIGQRDNIRGGRLGGPEDRISQVFCSTQVQASKLANTFNQRVKDVCTQELVKIEFLDCSVFGVKRKTDLDDIGLLVEKRLEGEYQKWNDNQGGVGEASKQTSYIPGGGARKQTNKQLMKVLLEDGVNPIAPEFRRVRNQSRS